MKKNWKIYMYYGIVILILSSCSSIAFMAGSKMNQLELGMSKKQVTEILGNSYTIAEKRMEEGNQIEILSYRDSYYNDEFYMFLFKNEKLERWYRELLPKYEIPPLPQIK